MEQPNIWPRWGTLCLLAWFFTSINAKKAPGYALVDPAQIRAILANMSVEERFLQTCIDSHCAESRARWLRCNPFGGGSAAGGGDAWFVLKDVERLGVRGMRLRDGPKGMTCAGGGHAGFGPPCPADGTSPSFPAQSLRAATWDVALEEEVGAAVGEIAALLDVHGALLPTINILPWLNWGRSQETYGEDPILSGKMGAAVVRGIQREGKVMATAKHFLANNIENTRWWVSAEMDEKTLHEVYLKAWAITVAESAPELVMTSYNRVQGKYPFMHPKFISILRERLGFQGSVMTDWFASWETITSGIILDVANSQAGRSSPFWGQKDFLEKGGLLKAGVDMEMPFCSKNRDIVSLLQTCTLDDAEACAVDDALDSAVARLLRSKIRYGLLGPSRNHSNSKPVTWNNAKYDELSLRVARQGIVLLKNEDNFLPRRAEKVTTVAVVGTPEILEQGDVGSSAVRPSGRLVTVLDGLKSKYKNVLTFNFSSSEDHEQIRRADFVVLDVGLNEEFEGEFLPPDKGGDRKYLTLHPEHVAWIWGIKALNKNIVVVISSGQTVLVDNFVHGVPAILWLGYPGPLGGQALAEILAGEVNPSGRMTTVTPKRAGDYLPKGTNLAPWSPVMMDAAPQYPYSHGFKHMWSEQIVPRFPMGWGLSYTTFAHGTPIVTVGSGPTPPLTVRVEVTNTGSLAGIETVQVYASCKTCKPRGQVGGHARLPIALIGFGKVHLAPGQTLAVDVAASSRDLAVYDAKAEMWLLQEGEYTILAGPHLDAAVLKEASFSVTADVVFDYALARKADALVEPRSCHSYKCVPAKQSEYIQEMRLPSSLPYDPLLVIVFILRIGGRKFLLLLAALAVLVPCCGFCCCLRRRCCKKAQAKAASPPGKKDA